MNGEGMRWTIHESPIGPLTVLAGPSGITDIAFPGRVRLSDENARAPMPDVAEKLDSYFAGELREFDLDLDLRGSRLQLAVWRQLMKIPYGETVSYGELARRVDPAHFPSGTEPWERARLVGGCNGQNRLMIVVPCHRVIGADGSLTGYAGGLQRKQALLELEGYVVGAGPAPRGQGHQQLSLP